MRDELSQRVLQIPADPRSLAGSTELSEALAEGRQAIASFIYEREDTREVLVIVLGPPRADVAPVAPVTPATPTPAPAPTLTPERALIGVLGIALVLVWFFLQR